MKTIFALLFCSIIFAQENFLIEDHNLVWQKVHNTEKTTEEIINFFQNSGFFTNIIINNNQLTAEFNNLTPEYKKAGYGDMEAPIYIVSSYLSGFLLVEFKDGKYRTTIKSINLIQKFNSPTTRQGEITDIERFALKRKNTIFRTMFLGASVDILNVTFDKITTIKEITTSDW